MTYVKKEIYIKSQTAIEENNLFFIEDVVAWLPCGKTTFYGLFPLDSDEMNTLKEMLEENKIKTKSSIRAKLYKGTKSSELLALYRLICTNEERQSLNQQYIEHKVDDKRKSISDLFPTEDELNEKE